MKTLLIDNYDSYTYNLFQLIAEVNGEEPVVVRNDAPVDGIPDLREFDNLVVSPGPGHPGDTRDFGIGTRLLASSPVPVLGVCLGHQGIALGERGLVEPAPQPRHGHLSTIRHDEQDLFQGLPQHFTAVRYHSLAVREPLPPALEATAWSEDGVLMGLRHRDRPLWGVQFHPESVLTEYGHRMLVNFRNLTAARAGKLRTKNTAVPSPEAPTRRRASVPECDAGVRRPAGARGARAAAASEARLSGRAAGVSGAEAGGRSGPVAGPLRAGGPRAAAVFPVSAMSRAAVNPAGEAVAGRSGAGDDAPLSPTPPTVAIPRPRRPGRVGYRLHTRRVTGAVDTEAVFTRMFAGSARAFWLDSSLVEPGRSRFSFLGDDSGPLSEFVRYDVTAGRCEIERAGRPVRKVSASVFDYLKRQLTNRWVDATGLPFDFTGGYVGYLGYEVKADCGSPNRHRSPAPDAAWLFADRVIAVDHEEGFTYAVCLAEDTPQAAREAADWLEGALAELSCVATERAPLPVPSAPADPGAAEPWLVRDRATYLADIEACQRELRAGTSYEVCLTNAARLPAPPDALEFYRTLRRDNPAPYAAFLRFGGLEVAGSSPERFLKIGRDGTAEARPIKGTAPRGDGPEEDARLRDALASDDKTRAENLMIVDLLRNDLGQVCRTGSVRVSKLMATETYATVHQLVSTVVGRLRPGTDAVDCVRACFPGGSMTGAPKLRTLEIIDSLETEARGVYSGALGYFGCGGGADLNIVIRTAVFADGQLHLGAGGAIVLGSDPEAEYDEMLLKTAAPMRALHQHTADRIRRQTPPGDRAGAGGEARR
ncbi:MULTISPECIES: aminodeoxychorismate synthase component I [Streptomyces]|uniref:aminodeoxychorismate synthase n=1 Tax=Streptomyces koelreuteriae TaxID=2838015 RepID=A0ABX8FQQ7_9ACTN|nr:MULTISPECIES: aminodeoxychorismate synthase component I [Streptomyces]QWB23511.1 aminodeoxychorismate synthase component I [Streptomyces koelreuteriae]UUA06467.1 aminodeoxychorismate synthase component I [Streptomyces koelreuteriae]UUA14095.1 aminodeoxychorismate synthase component I [Streptomyces sp. CRCS-T-1]